MAFSCRALLNRFIKYLSAVRTLFAQQIIRSYKGKPAKGLWYDLRVYTSICRVLDKV